MKLKILFQSLIAVALIICSCCGSPFKASLNASSEGGRDRVTRPKRAVQRIPDQRGLSDILVTTSDQHPNQVRSVQARISQQALRQPYTRPYSAAITNRMNRMGRIRGVEADDRGHIIASSLGGPAAPWNIFPQSPRMNRGPTPYDHDPNAPPSWKTLEGKVAKHLRGPGPGRRASYSVEFQYNDRNNPARPSDIDATARLYKNGRLHKTIGGMYTNENFGWGG